MTSSGAMRSTGLRRGWCGRWPSKAIPQGGRQRTGRPIDQQYIFALLRNRIYLGEIRNRGVWYAAQHEAIVPQDLWEAAHAFITRRKQAPREHRAKHPALLAGLLFAPDGQRMLHTFVKKKSGRVYRYYVPYLHKRRNAGASLVPDAPDVGHLPAAEIESAVLAQIHAALSAPGGADRHLAGLPAPPDRRLPR